MGNIENKKDKRFLSMKGVKTLNYADLCLKDGEFFATEPFNVGRETSRLLFDFSVMISFLKMDFLEYSVLDFGAGTGWITEFCAKMGVQTVAFDIHDKLDLFLKNRVCADSRINANLIGYAQGDGHSMPFEDESFGHLLCYDTLHHMHDYEKVFSEFFRVLKKGGRGIFVEPGARHSSSPETINFLKNSRRVNDPNWIERDVVIEEINDIAKKSGFNKGISIVPISSPLSLQVYSLEEWTEFRKGSNLQRLKITDQLAHLNYWDRVIFYVDKP